jgi:hypothetical protein
MEADLEAEIPSSSCRFPTKYRLSSENFPKERWDELTAPRASIAAWNRKKANKEVDLIICKPRATLEAEMKAMLSLPRNKHKRVIFTLFPDPEDDEVKEAIDNSHQLLFQQWGMTPNGDFELSDDGNEETQRLGEQPDTMEEAETELELGGDDDVDEQDLDGHYDEDSNLEAVQAAQYDQDDDPEGYSNSSDDDKSNGDEDDQVDFEPSDSGSDGATNSPSHKRQKKKAATPSSHHSMSREEGVQEFEDGIEEAVRDIDFGQDSDESALESGKDEDESQPPPSPPPKSTPESQKHLPKDVDKEYDLSEGEDDPVDPRYNLPMSKIKYFQKEYLNARSESLQWKAKKEMSHIVASTEKSSILTLGDYAHV